MKDMINYSDFQKLELVVGKILKAERVQGTDKLMKLMVDIGHEIQLIAGISQSYSADDLVGKNIVVLANLEPKKLKGLESQGMLLAADDNGKPILLTPDKKVDAGSNIM